MAKKPKPPGKKYNFMDTYGDMMTLLMCFFVLLFAMSTVEEEKFTAFAGALAQTFGAAPATPTEQQSTEAASDVATGEESPTGDLATDPDQSMPMEFSNLAEAVEQYIAENEMEGEVSVQVSENGVIFIRISDNLLFDGNSSSLRTQAEEFLDFLGAMFVSLEDEIYQIKALGHTASIPGDGTDDRILSAERSARVASYFERSAGFPPYKLLATGYGRHYPIGDNSTDEGRALNRRVDLVVVGNNPDTLMAALAESSQVYFPDDQTEFFEGPPEELPSTTIADLPSGQVSGLDTSDLTPEEVEGIQDVIDDYTAQEETGTTDAGATDATPADTTTDAAG